MEMAWGLGGWRPARFLRFLGGGNDAARGAALRSDPIPGGPAEFLGRACACVQGDADGWPGPWRIVTMGALKSKLLYLCVRLGMEQSRIQKPSWVQTLLFSSDSENSFVGFSHFFRRLFFTPEKIAQGHQKKAEREKYEKHPPQKSHRLPSQKETEIPIDSPQKNIGLVGLAKGAPVMAVSKNRDNLSTVLSGCFLDWFYFQVVFFSVFCFYFFSFHFSNFEVLRGARMS